MEEMKNNEVIEETMNDVEVIDLYPEEDGDDSGSNGLGKLVIAGLGIAAATVGGKAIGKGVGINKAESIINGVGVALSIFSFKKNSKKKNKNKKKDKNTKN